MHPIIKPGVFALEALNSLATTYYFYLVYFFLQRQFGFGNLENLAVAAVSGFIYTLGAVWGGRFGQRRGYFFALALAAVIMGISLLVGAGSDTVWVQLVVLSACTFGMTLSWPNLQAVLSEGEPPLRLQQLLGIYNVIWAGFQGVAYFTGGKLIETVGDRAIFIVPVFLFIVQGTLTVYLGWLARRPKQERFRARPQPIDLSRGDEKRHSPVPPERFLRMARIANPFCYVAVNAAVPVIPGLAVALELSPRTAGYFCSIWMFARAGSFLLFWLWPGWHYRFRFMFAAYLLLVASFCTILLSRNLPVLIGAQLFFGLSLGLIYYSSLYYSMNAAEEKGENSGIHEAVIGAGNCAGPAIGALALYFFPGHPGSGVIAVSAVLLGGLVWLLRVRWQKV